jgi:rhodanese-related sulfurtransferase
MKAVKFAVAGVALAFSALSFAADWAPGAANWDKLPEIKVTKLGLYLTPQQAYDMKKRDVKGVALFDIRTRAEAMYVGMATDVDALVPYVEHPEIMSDWDEKRTMYKLEPNQDFVPEIDRRLKELGLAKDAPVILLCRSGDRSSKAADRLQAAGYTRVYSVTEGFEGDRASEGPKKGQRVVNGWKNSDLPWSYKLDKAKMYFPR